MSATMFPADLLLRLHQTGVLAVLILDRPQDAVPVARALLSGGVNAMELTLRTPTALDALKRIRAEVPDMIVGAGTILTPEQVVDVVNAGAAFGVAPGTNRRVIDAAQRLGLPFAPGVCTPSDIESAVEAGCSLLKFFPAGPCGGLPYLRSIAAPFTHLGVKVIPLGGIDASNAADYLGESSVQALGGSWLAPRDVIQRQDWATITENARSAVEIVKRVRG
jgi:2-dehydro-3-deoxyphosphogluconate aldolase/(4S)-4-hydroxy-2-oxoglutarate aldolase